MRTGRKVLLLVTTLFLLQPAGFLLCSGVGQLRTVFVRTAHPDDPQENFLAGRFGVLQPEYWRWHLFVAYRYLAGMPLTAGEQQALRPLWDWKARQIMLKAGASAREALTGQDEWLSVRARVPGIERSQRVETYRQGLWNEQFWIAYLNCPDDAFRNAGETLEKRIQQFGASSSEIRDWVRAQDQVFSNCSGPGTFPLLTRNWEPSSQSHPASPVLGGNIPPPAPSDAPAILKADRAYQIAAAYFYAGDFDTAQEHFGGIAEDASSPWHVLAPYLVARCLTRRGTLGKPHGFDPAPLAQAEAQLEQILADSKLQSIHGQAADLVDFVGWRLHPGENLSALAHRLEKPDVGCDLYQDVYNYSLMLEKLLREGRPYGIQPPLEGFDAIPGSLRSDDLTDWIITFRAQDTAASRHALEKWEATHSLPWLVAVLTKTQPSDPQLPEVLAEARKVPVRSPAYLTVTYHILRLMMGSDREGEVRDKIDRLLANHNWEDQPSTLNLLRAQRMSLARDYQEFLRFVPREIAGFAFDLMPGTYGPGPYFSSQFGGKVGAGEAFDEDAVGVLNACLSISMLREAATDKVLPPRLRHAVAMAAWTRAFLLENEEVALELVPTLRELVPEISPFLDKYSSAKTRQRRRREGIWMVLNSPGLRPYVQVGLGRTGSLGTRDISRDNWWCSLDLDEPFERRRLFPPQPEPSQTGGVSPTALLYASPAFLKPAQKAAARLELQRLKDVEIATNYLSREVMAWARSDPKDPRIPRALATVVILPHAGCGNDQTGNYSRDAFRLLHRRYPASKEAKETKYWYK
jgi:hypothetical protein